MKHSVIPACPESFLIVKSSRQKKDSRRAIACGNDHSVAYLIST